ncbi:MAG: hypothetical protein V3W34_05340 [Phycisphaerae bacterium]
MFTNPQGIANKSLSPNYCGTGFPVCGTGFPAGPTCREAGFGIRSTLPRSVKVAALAVSLALSALLTAVALRSPDHHWLACISFLPLFVAIRWLGPSAAALAGGLWGACLYVFCTAGPAPGVAATVPAIDPTAPVFGPSAWLLALLIVIPAVYVGLAALPTRPFVFKLLVLALGWTLVETVLHLHNPSGPHEGPLTGSQGEGPHLHWLVRLLGYVFTAFLVACANTSLVYIVSGARLGFPAYKSLAGSPNVAAWHPSQVVLALQSWTLRQAYPRAPPF